MTPVVAANKRSKFDLKTFLSTVNGGRKIVLIDVAIAPVSIQGTKTIRNGRRAGISAPGRPKIPSSTSTIRRCYEGWWLRLQSLKQYSLGRLRVGFGPPRLVLKQKLFSFQAVTQQVYQGWGHIQRSSARFRTVGPAGGVREPFLVVLLGSSWFLFRRLTIRYVEKSDHRTNKFTVFRHWIRPGLDRVARSIHPVGCQQRICPGFARHRQIKLPSIPA
jgi:hypothetical protein